MPHHTYPVARLIRALPERHRIRDRVAGAVAAHAARTIPTNAPHRAPLERACLAAWLAAGYITERTRGARQQRQPRPPQQQPPLPLPSEREETP